MPRNIEELNITNFQNTGQTTPIARYTFDIEIKWRNEAGVLQTHSSTRTYPNALSDMPLRVQRRFVEEMIEAKVRVALGLAEWEDYE